MCQVLVTWGNVFEIQRIVRAVPVGRFQPFAESVIFARVDIRDIPKHIFGGVFSDDTPLYISIRSRFDGPLYVRDDEGDVVLSRQS
jgi:hypothetical protein